MSYEPMMYVEQNLHFWRVSMQSQTLSAPSHQTLELPKGNQPLAVVKLYVSKMTWNIFKHLNFRLTRYDLISEWKLVTDYNELKTRYCVIRVQPADFAASWSYENREELQICVFFHPEHDT